MGRRDLVALIAGWITGSVLVVCAVTIWYTLDSTVGKDSNPYQVTKLFSVETCNVYRFKDGWFSTQYLVECERGSKALGPVKYYDPNTHELKGKKP